MRETPQEKKVHELRRRVKSLRALARLLGQLGARNARDVNYALGALGRQLSDERDLTVRNAWLEKNGFPELTQKKPRRRPPPLPLAQVNEEAKKLRHEAELAILEPARLEAALKTTAKKARRARRRAKQNGTSADFHRWRKRVRDLLEQSKLLGIAENPPLHRLVKQLGKAQDTIVVREGLRGRAGAKRAMQRAKKEGEARRQKALREKLAPVPRLNAAHRENLARHLRPRKTGS